MCCIVRGSVAVQISAHLDLLRSSRMRLEREATNNLLLEQSFLFDQIPRELMTPLDVSALLPMIKSGHKNWRYGADSEGRQRAVEAEPQR